jgi:hypothetical protein
VSSLLAASVLVGAVLVQSDGLGWRTGSAPAPSDSPPALASEVAAASPSGDPLLLDDPMSGMTLPPDPSLDASASPAGAPSPAAGAVATRIVIARLGIDLPVIRQAPGYPACDVAMYLVSLKQPGQGGVTYVYAHARTGMFLPLLTQSRINNGAAMLGMAVEVYTEDSRKHTYQVSEVRRHIVDLRAAFAWQGESVWLQTSEGPNSTYPKLQLVSTWVATEGADFEAAHPDPQPVRC